MDEPKKRKWCYALGPEEFDMKCDRCGGVDIEWSQWEGMIWCRHCQVDTDGENRLFAGGLIVSVSGNVQISLDRVNMETGEVEWCYSNHAKGGDVEWHGITQVAENLLLNPKFYSQNGLPHVPLFQA